MDPVFNSAAALILAWIMATSAWHKARDVAAFRESIVNYRLLPAGLAVPLAWLFPAAEFAAGIGLLAAATRPAAATATVALLLVYTAAITINLLRGRTRIDCGCGGPGQKQFLSGWLLLRNGLLIVLGLVATSDSVVRELGWFDIANIACAAIAGCLTWHAGNQLLANRDLLASLRHGHG
jgi:hypothetical protein